MWLYQFVGNLTLSQIKAIAFLSYLKKKMFLAMKTEISLHASRNPKNIIDSILFAFMVSLREERQKIEAQKRLVLSRGSLGESVVKPGPGSVLFILFEISLHLFILLFSPTKSFGDNESEVPIRATFPQSQGRRVEAQSCFRPFIQHQTKRSIC